MMKIGAVIALSLVGCAHSAPKDAHHSQDATKVASPVPWPPAPLSEEARRRITRSLYRIGPPVAARRTSHHPGCVLSGSVDEVRLPLFATIDANEPFAILEQGDFETVVVPKSSGAHVEAELNWPLHAKVYLRQESQPFSLRAPVPLETDVAWLGAGARVAATSSDGSMATITRTLAASPQAAFVPETFASSIACKALLLPRLANLFPGNPDLRDGRPLGPNQAVLAAAPEGGELAELTEPAPIAARPGAPTSLRVGGPEWPVQLYETRGRWALVSDRNVASSGQHGFDFRGWVPSASVRRGGIRTAVSLGRVELPPSHQACGNAELRREPRRDAPIVAHLTEALPLLVVDHRQDFAAVLVPGLMPVSVGGLWVHRSSLCAGPAQPSPRQPSVWP